MTKKISETLSAARAIIADPSNWTQGAFARDAFDHPVKLRSTSAVCFCADGAVALAAGVQETVFGAWQECADYSAASTILREAAEKMTTKRSYVNINDGDEVIPLKTPHEAILMCLDLGIDLAKSREELGMERVAP
jgi:hypothetical protein